MCASTETRKLESAATSPWTYTPDRRGRGRQVRFGAFNVLYDEDGNSYPVDDAGQLYIPLELAQDAGDAGV